ncbi:hypothetical protein [Sorangium sp. So ce1335]|uniref:hypothetical protein n=1 Tax=Sorangium sp. So ce1335 TaxID=3133335 RepID=UPI003F5EC8E4
MAIASPRGTVAGTMPIAVQRRRDTPAMGIGGWGDLPSCGKMAIIQAGRSAISQPARQHRTRMHGVPPALTPVAERLFTMSLGFWRPSPPTMPLLGPTSFGHPGSGGSLGFADAEARVGFGYVPNLWPVTMVDPRAIKLTSAVAQRLE